MPRQPFSPVYVRARARADLCFSHLPPYSLPTSFRYTFRPLYASKDNCDFCHSDIVGISLLERRVSPRSGTLILSSPFSRFQTHTVRIKCAAPGCEEVDLCPSCFCRGKEGGKHKRWHDYRVVVSLLSYLSRVSWLESGIADLPRHALIALILIRNNTPTPSSPNPGEPMRSSCSLKVSRSTVLETGRMQQSM
jgi:hypothetical protein